MFPLGSLTSPGQAGSTAVALSPDLPSGGSVTSKSTRPPAPHSAAVARGRAGRDTASSLLRRRVRPNILDCPPPVEHLTACAPVSLPDPQSSLATGPSSREQSAERDRPAGGRSRGSSEASRQPLQPVTVLPGQHNGTTFCCCGADCPPDGVSTGVHLLLLLPHVQSTRGCGRSRAGLSRNQLLEGRGARPWPQSRGLG